MPALRKIAPIRIRPASRTSGRELGATAVWFISPPCCRGLCRKPLSVELRPRGLGELSPTLDFGGDESGELLRRGPRRLEPLAHQRIVRVRRIERLHQHGVELRDHLRWRAGGRDEPAPEISVVLWQPGFDES